MSFLSTHRTWLERFIRFEDVLKKYPLPPNKDVGCQLHFPGGLGSAFALEHNGQWVHMTIVYVHVGAHHNIKSVTLEIEST